MLLWRWHPVVLSELFFLCDCSVIFLCGSPVGVNSLQEPAVCTLLYSTHMIQPKICALRRPHLRAQEVTFLFPDMHRIVLLKIYLLKYCLKRQMATHLLLE